MNCSKKCEKKEKNLTESKICIKIFNFNFNCNLILSLKDNFNFECSFFFFMKKKKAGGGQEGHIVQIFIIKIIRNNQGSF